MSYCRHSLFFLHAPATTEIYTLSLHDALPISEDEVQHGNHNFCADAAVARRRSQARAHPLQALGALVQRRMKGNEADLLDRKSTRLNSSHPSISYAVFCLKKKKNKQMP